MNFELIVLILFGLFIVLYGMSKKSSSADSDSYGIEDKKLNFWQVFFGIFSVVGGGEFIYVTELAYDFGVFSSILFFSFSIGCLVFLFFYKKITWYKDNKNWKKERKYDIRSVPDISNLYFGLFSARLSTIYMFLSLGALLLIQLALGGMIIEILTGLSQDFSIILMTIILGAYTIAGGFGSVLGTDKMQIIVLFIAFSILAIFYEPNLLTETTLNLDIFKEKSSFPDIQTIMLILVGGICWVLGGSDIWLRITSADNNKIVKKSLIWNAVALFVFGLLVAILGTKIASSNPSFEASNAFIESLRGLEFGYFKITVILGLFAGLISTADTELHAISNLLYTEFYRNSDDWHLQEEDPIKQKIKEKKKVKHEKIIVGLVAIIALIIAIFAKKHLIQVYLTLLNVFIILGSYMLMTLLKRGNKAASIISLILSGIILIYVAIVDVSPSAGLLVAVPPILLMLFFTNKKEL